MNKSDLVVKITEDTGFSKKDVGLILDSALDNITLTLSEGGKVQLVGFGTFSVKDRKARIGRNPQTGEEMNIEASKKPAFKPGKTLDDLVKA